jgi:hypothetical protein
MINLIKDKILEFEEKIDKDREKNKQKWIYLSLIFLMIMTLSAKITDNNLLINLQVIITLMLFAFVIIYLAAKAIKNKIIGISVVVLGIMIMIAEGGLFLIYGLITNTPFLQVDKNTPDHIGLVFILVLTGVIIYAIEYLIKSHNLYSSKK